MLFFRWESSYFIWKIPHTKLNHYFLFCCAILCALFIKFSDNFHFPLFNHISMIKQKEFLVTNWKRCNGQLKTCLNFTWIADWWLHKQICWIHSSSQFWPFEFLSTSIWGKFLTKCFCPKSLELFNAQLLFLFTVCSPFCYWRVFWRKNRLYCKVLIITKIFKCLFFLFESSLTNRILCCFCDFEIVRASFLCFN